MTKRCLDPVVVVPSSFFIGCNGIPLEVIAGSVEPPELLHRIDKLFQVRAHDINVDRWLLLIFLLDRETDMPHCHHHCTQLLGILYNS